MLFLLTGYVIAQTPVSTSCGQKEANESFLRLNPRSKLRNDQIERAFGAFRRNAQRSGSISLRTTDIISLPVVVHILHQNGPENIPDAQVQMAIQHLNQAFSNTAYYQSAGGAATGIQFCLARRAPDGTSTNGINRVESPSSITDGWNNPEHDRALKNVIRWTPSCYINIWVVKEIPGDVAGYAYLPAAHGTDVDGIVLESGFFGTSDQNDVVLTHEMGHYLGLYHTFEGNCTNNDCTTDGDRVCDTPPDQTRVSTNCGLPVNSCDTDTKSGFSTDRNDLTDNFMDYGNLSCIKSFTPGQAERMNWHITNVRQSLLTCSSCNSPCPAPVVSHFTSSSKDVGIGEEVHFTNTSANATLYTWLVNGTPESSDKDFSATFSAPGIYLVQLDAASGDPLCGTSGFVDTIKVSCAVHARFTPLGKTLLINESILFTNTSTGANGYEWQANGITSGTGVEFSFSATSPGIQQITLIAHGNTCDDSVTTNFNVTTPCSNDLYHKKYYNDQQHFNPSDICTLDDGGSIVTGEVQNYLNNRSYDGLLARFSSNGDLTWGKLIMSTKSPDRSQGFNVIKRTSDNDIITLGTVEDGTNPIDGGLLFCKFDLDGNVRWSKKISKDPNYIITIGDIAETNDKGYVFQASYEDLNGGSNRYDLIIGKLDNQGNLLWSKIVQFENSTIYAGSVLVDNDNLLFSGSMGFRRDDPKEAFLMKVNGATGSLLWSKTYGGESHLRFYDIAPDGDNLLVRATYYQTSGLPVHALIQFNNTGDIGGYSGIKYGETTSLMEQVGTITPDKQLFAGEFLPNPGNKMYLSVSGKDGSVAFSKSFQHSYYPFVRNVIPGAGGTIMAVGSTFRSQNDTRLAQLYVIKTDFAGISTDCSKELTTSSPSLTIRPTARVFTSYEDFQPAQTDYAIVLSDFTVTTETICGTYNECYSLALSAKDSVCGNTPMIVSATRNPGCTQKVRWTVPTGVAYTVLNDTTIQLTSGVTGTITIKGALDGCASAIDSVVIHFFRSSGTVDIGNDRELCQISTLPLNAGDGFKSYFWQDGSTDSSYTAYTAGKFFVNVEDFCGERHTDSVSIVRAISRDFKFSGDFVKCITDTIVVEAPAGFTKFYWSPRYMIDDATLPGIKLYPDKNTFYTVIGETSTGCTSIDTLKVIVSGQGPSRFLPDTLQLCSGEQAKLTANQTFLNYLWFDNSTLPYVYVANPGKYWAIVTDEYGCKGRDTVQVVAKDCRSGNNQIYFPNSFSPNNDNLNDIFRPRVTGSLRQFRLTIFNRFGQKVFESNDPRFSWDGTQKGEPTVNGTFVWSCTYRFADDERTHNVRGTVTIIK
jgi:gliding motility-associated-like protein